MLKVFNWLYTEKLPSCPFITQASLSDRIISLCFIGMAWFFWMFRTLDSSIILISHQSHLNSAGVADVLRSPALPTVRSFNATNSLNILPCLTYSTGTLRANFAITLPKKPFVDARWNALMDKICLHVLTRCCGLLPWHVSPHTCKVPLAVITTDPCQLKPLWICQRFFPHPCLTPWQLHIVKQEWCGQEQKGGCFLPPVSHPPETQLCLSKNFVHKLWSFFKNMEANITCEQYEIFERWAKVQNWWMSRSVGIQMILESSVSILFPNILKTLLHQNNHLSCI